MMVLIVRILRAFILINRLVLRKLIQLDQHLSPHSTQSSHNHLVVRSTQRHDMFEDADEKYYASEYWEIFKRHLSHRIPDPGFTIVDLGCGQGRNSLPLARWAQSHQGRVVGIDLSRTAIEAAKKNAVAEKLDNCRFVVADIFEYLKTLEDESLDIVFLIEVTFFMKDPLKTLQEIRRTLKPGGVLFANFRPQYFNVLSIIKEGLWGSTDMVLNQRSGRLTGTDINLTWTTAKEIKELISQDLGFNLLELSSVGSCSGIAGDPHSGICRPSLLTAAERQRLSALERRLGADLPDTGRYMVSVSLKN